MTVDMVIVLTGITLMLAGLFFEIARPDLLVFFTLFMFMLLGLVTTQEALVGFSNPGMLTIALLFVIAAVIERSGLVERFISWFLQNATTARGALVRLLFPISFFSAFLNNTPIVATLTPIIKKWASEKDMAPSKFLIPLSYASILGGTITLIGTSTTLVVHGLLLENGEGGFSFFQLAIVGVPITIVGVIYLSVFAPRILPDHKSLIEKFSKNTKDYLSEMVVTSSFPFIDETIEEASLRNLKGLYLIEILRGEEVLSPVTPDMKIQQGDRLIFTGMISTIAELQHRKGLELDTGTDLSLDQLSDEDTSLQEIVVSHQSSLLGRTIKESRFRDRYDAAVMAVHRNDERVQGKIGEIRPKAGDVLLLITGEKFEEKTRDVQDFYITSPIDRGEFYTNEKQGWLSLLLLAGMITLVTFQVIDIFKAMVITVGVLLLFRFITPNQAKISVQFQVLLLIASALGIGNVISITGTGEFLATQMVGALKPFGTLALLFAIYLMTNVLTELITNNAAAVIMFPIAYEMALNTSMNPVIIAILVAVAASASFMSPIGYQTNLIVYGPGGYKFTDYAKVGFPLTMIVMGMTVSIIYLII